MLGRSPRKVKVNIQGRTSCQFMPHKEGSMGGSSQRVGAERWCCAQADVKLKNLTGNKAKKPGERQDKAYKDTHRCLSGFSDKTSLSKSWQFLNAILAAYCKIRHVPAD